MSFTEYVLITIVMVLVYAVIFTVPTYFVWNWLMPDIFHLKEINIWQAFGIVLLSKMFFTSMPDARD